MAFPSSIVILLQGYLELIWIKTIVINIFVHFFFLVYSVLQERSIIPINESSLTAPEKWRWDLYNCGLRKDSSVDVKMSRSTWAVLCHDTSFSSARLPSEGEMSIFSLDPSYLITPLLSHSLHYASHQVFIVTQLISPNPFSTYAFLKLLSISTHCLFSPLFDFSELKSKYIACLHIYNCTLDIKIQSPFQIWILIALRHLYNF